MGTKGEGNTRVCPVQMESIHDLECRETRP